MLQHYFGAQILKPQTALIERMDSATRLLECSADLTSMQKNSPVFQRGWQDLVIVEDIGATATSRSAAQGAACLFSTLIEAIPD